MNDDWENLERMLEHATRAADAPPDDCGPEANRLRETWLAFGRMLDAAQATKPTPRRPFLCDKRRWSAIASGALAATVLLGLGVYWAWIVPAAKKAMPTNSVVADNQQRNPSKNQSAVAQRQTSAAADDLQWNDSLDESLETVAWNAVYASSTLSQKSNPVNLLRHDLSRVSGEIESSSF